MTRSTVPRDHNHFVSASPRAHPPSTVSATPSLALGRLQAASGSPRDASVGLQWPQLLPIIRVESKKLGKRGCAGGRPMSRPGSGAAIDQPIKKRINVEPVKTIHCIPYTLEHYLTLISTSGVATHNNCVAQSSRQAGGVGTPTRAAVGMEKKREGKDNNKVEITEKPRAAKQHAEGGGGLRKGGGGLRSKQGIALAGAIEQINFMGNMQKVAVTERRKQSSRGAGGTKCEREGVAVMVVRVTRKRPIVFLRGCVYRVGSGAASERQEGGAGGEQQVKAGATGYAQMYPREATRGGGTGKIRRSEGAEQPEMESVECIRSPESCSTGERAWGGIQIRNRAKRRRGRRPVGGQKRRKRGRMRAQSGRRRLELSSHRKRAQESARRASEKVLEAAGRKEDAGTWPPSWQSNWPP
ncbi:hypothetical protein B0H14DRAFT_3769963 [Mycena olivaceomarginata]|nr:hypothetical protein B0H14DRAFT_3769963 [Mycena olivaceomarginata]